MGIDGIGKGGRPGGVGGGDGADGARGGVTGTEGKTPFEVRKRASEAPDAVARAAPNTPASVTPGVSSAGGANAAAGTGGVSPLAELKAGRIDMPRYLDLKVEQATSHLKGLRASELETIKATLREKLAFDPTLADLVKGATGHMPPPPADSGTDGE